MTDYPALIRQLLEALEIGRDSAYVEAQNFHGAMKGYRPHEHQQYDDDLAKIDAAIIAARAALEAPQEREVDWSAPERRCGGPGCDGNYCVRAPVQPPKQEPVALVTYHRDDTGQKAAEAYAAMVAQLSKENIRKLANEVAHGAKATLGRESIALTREDWSDIKLIPLATPQPQPAIPQGTQPAMGQFTLTEDGAERLTWLLATDGGEGKEITLSIGMGHSGFGLYAWEAEYPEEGATFIETTSKPELFVAPPSPANPQGWKLVPLEPTGEMLEAMARYAEGFPNARPLPALWRWTEVYRAALSASPAPPEEKEPTA